jgi:hypothetical protein
MSLSFRAFTVIVDSPGVRLLTELAQRSYVQAPIELTIPAHVESDRLRTTAGTRNWGCSRAHCKRSSIAACFEVPSVAQQTSCNNNRNAPHRQQLRAEALDKRAKPLFCVCDPLIKPSNVSNSVLDVIDEDVGRMVATAQTNTQALNAAQSFLADELFRKSAVVSAFLQHYRGATGEHARSSMVLIASTYSK